MAQIVVSLLLLFYSSMSDETTPANSSSLRTGTVRDGNSNTTKKSGSETESESDNEETERLVIGLELPAPENVLHPSDIIHREGDQPLTLVSHL